MRIYDISVPLSLKTPAYPGEASLSITPTLQIAQGGFFNSSALSLSSHTGTHVDAPCHVIGGGSGVDALPLEALIGRTWVCELDAKDAITVAHLAALDLPEDTERLLFKTRNSRLWQQPGFQEGFTYIREDAARWLVSQGIKLVGVDYLSVEQFGSPRPSTHQTLLKAGIVILEGLDLSEVSAGGYTLVCLPLRIKDGDGAPARAVLIEGWEP